MVNGAGLAMATMDLLNHSGLPAANFMDLGGAADYDRMRTAMALLFEDQAVTAVLINIFGGVLSCEKVALALSEALEGRPPAKPLVVRLAGNQSVRGREILAGLAGERLTIVGDMSAAIARLKELDGQDGAAAARQTGGPLSLEFAPAPFPPALGFEAGLPVLVQGLTGRTAQLHARLMQGYGTNIVAGVTPFKGGQEACGVPVYNSVREAQRRHAAQASIIFVPPAFPPEAIVEARARACAGSCALRRPDPAGHAWCASVAPTDARSSAPNCPAHPRGGPRSASCRPRLPAGRWHRFASGTLSYETAARLSAAGIAKPGRGHRRRPIRRGGITSSCSMQRDDANTRRGRSGEIGGSAEEDLARWVAATGFPTGGGFNRRADRAHPGKRLGHRGPSWNRARACAQDGHHSQAGFAVPGPVEHPGPVPAGWDVGTDRHCGSAQKLTVPPDTPAGPLCFDGRARFGRGRQGCDQPLGLGPGLFGAAFSVHRALPLSPGMAAHMGGGLPKASRPRGSHVQRLHVHVHIWRQGFLQLFLMNERLRRQGKVTAPTRGVHGLGQAQAVDAHLREGRPGTGLVGIA
jgi:succinyl-CoA synthetase alpha subunit